MNIVEPFTHLKIDDNDDPDGRFVSFWRFSCLPGCIVCEISKPIDVMSNNLPLDQCFTESEWFLVSHENDLKLLSNDVNQKFQYNYSCRIYDAIRRNREYNEEFHRDLDSFDKRFTETQQPGRSRPGRQIDSLLKVFYLLCKFVSLKVY